MPKRIRWAVGTLIAACALVWVAAPLAAVDGRPGAAKPQADAAAPENAADRVTAEVRAWLRVLSRQEAFAGWEQADIRLHPLGPGTHAWAAILTREGEEIGYVIVGATPDGEYRLLEYGTGAYPLFSWNTLHRALAEWRLIPAAWTADDLARAAERPGGGAPVAIARRYEPPLLAVWEVAAEDGNRYLFDAKTGEEYPPFELEGGEGARPERPAEDGASIRLAKALQQVETKGFDPFADLFWIRDADGPGDADFAAVLDHLKAGAKVVYTTRILGGEVTLPFAVIGVHVWGEQSAAVMLDHYGPRLIAYEALARAGVFHLR
jgi:hypothetical protein